MQSSECKQCSHREERERESGGKEGQQGMRRINDRYKQQHIQMIQTE